MQNIMKSKIRTGTSLVICIAVLSTTLYIVVNHLPVLLGSFRYFWGPLALVAILISMPAAFTTKSMRYLLIYGIISLVLLQYTLWDNMNDWNRNALLEEFYALFVFIAIVNYYLTRHDFKGLAFLGELSFIFILITIIMSHVVLFIDPFIIRMSISASHFTPDQENIFNFYGAGGYGYMQALVCILPILVYHIKFNKQMVFSPKILIFILIIILILHIRAQVFANLLVAFFITILSFVSSRQSKKLMISMVLFFILFIVIPASFYSNMFVSLGSYFDHNSIIYYKLNDFAVFIENPDYESITDAGGRVARYPLLYEAFIANPLLGDASYTSPFNIEAGGHLFWMNKLAIWGILGFALFVYMLYQLYKNIRSIFDDDFGFYYFLSVVAFIMLGLMKTIAGRETFLILIVVIPGLYFLPLLKTNE